MRTLASLLVAALVGASSLAIPSSATAANCQFTLGFKTLQSLIPAVVGNCLVNEHYNPASGDGLQETTRGLLVWRKADNWTAFTDGYRTWINGPLGLQERLNTQRFAWEDGSPQTVPAATGRQMSVYQVTNLSGATISVEHTFDGPNGFHFSFTSRLGPHATQTFHVRDMPSIPTPFDGTLHLSASGPFSAKIIGYDQP